MSAVDICRIIKQCSQANVSELTFNGLSLKFHSHSNENADQPSQAADQTSQSLVSEGFLERKDTLDQVYMDEESEREAEEAQLMIDDPLGFERLQIAKQTERSRHQ